MNIGDFVITLTPHNGIPEGMIGRVCDFFDDGDIEIRPLNILTSQSITIPEWNFEKYKPNARIVHAYTMNPAIVKKVNVLIEGDSIHQAISELLDFFKSYSDKVPLWSAAIEEVETFTDKDNKGILIERGDGRVGKSSFQYVGIIKDELS